MLCLSGATEVGYTCITMFDLIIIGGGPAGSAAAVYAARKQLKTLLVAKEFGGQSMVSPEIYNWIGTPKISGLDLASGFEEHARAYEGEYLKIITGELVNKVEKKDENFTVTTDKENTFESKTVLVCSGSNRRKLTIPGADEFEHKGLTYCATCDGPLFSGKDVVVVGGGNAGFETAAQLLAYTKSVTLLQRGPAYKADATTVEKVLAHPNMTGILNANIKEIKGEVMVSGIVYSHEGKDIEIPVQGVFAEIGQMPSTDFVEGLVDLDKYKRIIIDPLHQSTSLPGIWAAGDATNILYHQNNISAGRAIEATEDLYLWLKAR